LVQKVRKGTVSQWLAGRGTKFYWGGGKNRGSFTEPGGKESLGYRAESRSFRTLEATIDEEKRETEGGKGQAPNNRYVELKDGEFCFCRGGRIT